MTLYSTLPIGSGKTTVVATWAGQFEASNSAKVTTFNDAAQALAVAEDLTRVSEAMWDAAAWLDVYEPAENRLQEIVHDARRSDPVLEASEPLFTGCRHAKSWTGADLSHALSLGLPPLLTSLTRAQRLSVADELATDGEARTQSLTLLPRGHDPAEQESRIWQGADFGRATKLGLTGPFPDCAAEWVARVFDTQHGPAERWGARNILHRIEQLEAAAKTLHARGRAELDDFTGPVAHLVLPAQLFGVHRDTSDLTKRRLNDDIDPAVAGSALTDAYREHARTAEWVSGDAVLYIRPDFDTRRVVPWGRDVFAKMTIELSTDHKSTLATVDSTDTEGFAKALGSWVTRALYRG